MAGPAGVWSKTSRRWRIARGCRIVILLACIVLRRREASHDEAAQLEQSADRQMRDGGDFGVRGLRTRHPGWHRARCAVGLVHDIVTLVVTVVPPDHDEAVRMQWMKAVVDRDFSRAALMGSRSEEHTSELQSLAYLVCRLLLEK